MITRIPDVAKNFLIYSFLGFGADPTEQKHQAKCRIPAATCRSGKYSAEEGSLVKVMSDINRIWMNEYCKYERILSGIQNLDLYILPDLTNPVIIDQLQHIFFRI